MCKFESLQSMKAELSRLIPRKLAANLELLIGVGINRNRIFLSDRMKVCKSYLVFPLIALYQKTA